MMTDQAWFRLHRSADFRIRPPIMDIVAGQQHEPWGRSGKPARYLGRELWTCQVCVNVRHGSKSQKAGMFSFSALRPEPGEESNPWLVLTDYRIVRCDDVRRALRPGISPDTEMEVMLLDLEDRSAEFKRLNLRDVGARMRHFAGFGTLRIDDVIDFEPTDADLWTWSVAFGASVAAKNIQLDMLRGGEEYDGDEALGRNIHDLAALRMAGVFWEKSAGVIYRLSPELIDHIMQSGFDADEEAVSLPKPVFVLDLSCAPASLFKEFPFLPNAIIVTRYGVWATPEHAREAEKAAAVGWISEFSTAAELGSKSDAELQAEIVAQRLKCRIPAVHVQALVDAAEAGSFLNCERSYLGETWRDWRDDIASIPNDHHRFAALIHRFVYTFCRLAALRVKVGRPFDNPATETPKNPRKAGPHGPKKPSIIAADATITLPRKVYESAPVQSPGTGPDRAHLIPAETTRAKHKREQRFGPGRSLVRTIEIAERPKTKVYRRPDRTETRVNVLLGDVPKGAVSE